MDNINHNLIKILNDSFYFFNIIYLYTVKKIRKQKLLNMINLIEINLKNQSKNR